MKRQYMVDRNDEVCGLFFLAESTVEYMRNKGFILVELEATTQCGE